jgi:hypothetical protein
VYYLNNNNNYYYISFFQLFIYNHIKHNHIIQFHAFNVHTITQHMSMLSRVKVNMVGTSSCDTMLSNKNFIILQCLNI